MALFLELSPTMWTQRMIPVQLRSGGFPTSYTCAAPVAPYTLQQHVTPCSAQFQALATKKRGCPALFLWFTLILLPLLCCPCPFINFHIHPVININYTLSTIHVYVGQACLSALCLSLLVLPHTSQLRKLCQHFGFKWLMRAQGCDNLAAECGKKNILKQTYLCFRPDYLLMPNISGLVIVSRIAFQDAYIFTYPECGTSFGKQAGCLKTHGVINLFSNPRNH